MPTTSYGGKLANGSWLQRLEPMQLLLVTVDFQWFG